MSIYLSILIAAGLGSANPGTPTDQHEGSRISDAGTQALPPVYINFQGHLRQGVAIINDPAVNMTFRVYNAATGGTLIWGPWNTTTGVSQGVFNVALPIPRSAILGYQDLWVEVEIPAYGGIYIPRTKINAAAYAYNAYMADTAQRVQDNSINLYDIAGFNELAAVHPNLFDWDMDDNGLIDADLLEVPTGSNGYIWNYEVSGVQQPTSSFWITRQSTVGNPADTALGGIFAMLRPESGGTPYAAFWGQRGTTRGYGAIAGGFYGGYFLSRTQPNNVGVYAWCDADTGQGVLAVGNTATSIGVWGIGNVADAVGVLGNGNGAAGTYYLGTGVAGISDIIGTYGYGAYGVYGWAENVDGGYGVYGISDNTTNSIGVYGENASSTWGGVYGFSANADGVGVLACGTNEATVYSPPAGQGAGMAATGYDYGVYGTSTGGTGAYFNGNGITTRYGFLGLNAAYEGAANDFGGIMSAINTGGVGFWGVGSRSTIGNFVYSANTGVCGLGEDQGVYGRPDVAQGDANEVEGYLGLNGNTWGVWIGVYGYENDQGGTGIDDGSWAGYLDGDVWVVDDLYADDFYNHAKGQKGSDLLATAPKTVYRDAMISGSARLSGGKVSVKLDPDFLNMVDPSSMRVIATPVGAPVNVYVSEITSDGFVLRSVDGQDCRVDWMVTAYEYGVAAKIDQSKASEPMVSKPKLTTVSSSELKAASSPAAVKKPSTKSLRTLHGKVERRGEDE